MDKLDGKKVAILVADGFEQVEMTKPRQALDDAGAETKIVSLKSGKIQGMNHMEKGDKFDVDLTLDEARPEEFDALMIPGGLYNPDAMRSNEEAHDFSRHFFEAGKPVATICHGPQVLISANLVRGRKMTSWPAIKVDMRNAGANFRVAELFELELIEFGQVVQHAPPRRVIDSGGVREVQHRISDGPELDALVFRRQKAAPVKSRTATESTCRIEHHETGEIVGFAPQSI